MFVNIQNKTFVTTNHFVCVRCLTFKSFACRTTYAMATAKLKYSGLKTSYIDYKVKMTFTQMQPEFLFGYLIYCLASICSLGLNIL